MSEIPPIPEFLRREPGQAFKPRQESEWTRTKRAGLKAIRDAKESRKRGLRERRRKQKAVARARGEA